MPAARAVKDSINKFLRGITAQLNSNKIRKGQLKTAGMKVTLQIVLESVKKFKIYIATNMEEMREMKSELIDKTDSGQKEMKSVMQDIEQHIQDVNKAYKSR